MCTQQPKRFKEIAYRFRPKVECLFSAVKEKFGSYVRTIRAAGPTNEIMLKFLCYNIWMLVLAAQVHGLDADLKAPAAA